MDRKDFVARVLLPSTQHTCFYHFTDVRNLDSIRKHGLLAMSELKRRGITVAAPGGDYESQVSDQANGTDHYVCLCMTNSHPMAYRVRESRGLNLIYLQIHANVIFQHGAMITSEASNKRGVEKIDAAEALDNLDLEVLYKRTEWSDPTINTRLRAAEKYELLIPKYVPHGFIMNLNG